MNATQAWRAADEHARELPGSITVIERKVNGAWVRSGSEIFNQLLSAESKTPRNHD